MPRLDQFSLALFLQQLRVLIQGGRTEAEAVEALARHTRHPGLRQTLSQALTALHSGRPLTEALFPSGHPFPPNLVRCFQNLPGEAQELSHTLETLEDHFRLRTTLVESGPAPGNLAFIGLLFLIIVLLFLFILAPVFEGMYSDFGAALPLLTQAVFTSSHWLRSYWPLFVLVVAGAGYLLYRGLLAPSLASTRTHHVFSLMLGRVRGGAEPVRALAWATQAQEDRALCRRLNRVLEKVHNGLSLAESFRRTRGFPPLLADLLKRGEDTKDLTPALEEIVAHFAGNLRRGWQGYGLLAETIFILAVLVVLGTLFLSMYVPLFKLAVVTG
ncbi:MAG: type II secretion system F family protein [Thermodesulfobacteriota bacterium]